MDDLARLGADLRRELARFDDEAVKEIQGTVRSVAAVAQANAGWSSRIPRSIRVAETKEGAQLLAGGDDAPHAPTFEAARGVPVRHPVYGRGDPGGWTWVYQEPRPFLEPAIESTDADLLRNMGGVVDTVFGRAGFH